MAKNISDLSREERQEMLKIALDNAAQRGFVEMTKGKFPNVIVPAAEAVIEGTKCQIQVIITSETRLFIDEKAIAVAVFENINKIKVQDN